MVCTTFSCQSSDFPLVAGVSCAWDTLLGDETRESGAVEGRRLKIHEAHD